MSQTRSILTVVTVLLLAVQLCRGDTSCTISSSAGSMVQRGSSFNVSCTFNCVCKGSMSSNHPPTPQKHIKFNDTTIYYNVVDISQNRTFSCHCTCSAALDPCGLDISAGYPPDRPTNISCIYKVKSKISGVVICTWNRGRDTFLWTTSELWVRTGSGNHTVKPVTYNVTSNGSDSSSASLTVSSSVEVIAVWVKVRNGLGSAVSVTQNYTLSDIAMPSTPELGRPDCSSRECSIRVKQSVKTQHLEIQYGAEAQAWTSHPNSSSAQVQTISSLEPYRLYYFRARSKFSSGLWSQWSSNISSWTQEEAPAKVLDVWYAEPASDFESLTVYWKEVDISIARGNIIGYRVSVHSQNSGFIFSADVNADARSYTVQFCADCEVTVSARNSKGMSPPARITNQNRNVNPLKVEHNAAGNHSVAISWRNRGTAHAAYVVEWYPQGHKMEELRWVRLSRADHQAVITGIQPYECYEGAVSVVYHDNSVSRSPFTGVTILESAPTAGPSVDGKVEGNKVTVTWKKIPRGQRGGCITHYTIYLEGDSRDLRTYDVKASERTHVVKDLPGTVYKLWMTASTAKGEGHAGQKVYVQIVGVAEDVQLSLILVCAGVVVIGLLLVCLYQTKAVKQRVWVLFQCLKLDDVPDPANSKWAKECTQEKGKIKLQLQPSNSTITEEEEEPILVDVEELPKQSTDTHRPTDVSSQLPPLAILSPSTEPASLLYPLTTYLKSFSHDSDSSDHTQTSLDTSTTVDYISSHGQENIDEEEDEEEPFEDMLGFFPTHSIVIDQLAFGGKLTLDAVKIGGSDFFSGQPFLEEEHY
ncbi:interleukin-12 receptor subunit beta-2 [Acanthopagrus latus]|uniref:interleukin-12 receptor subunit beta-2 n=1 Tax=Acanthopagrus latus TaxID=8177 RepID=UPI00187C9EE8|nr:interleukin-12 receptor subunit beta-2 [Acanthopagrus latus]XP_036971811.1 interleukin-12 receptor subunit beta-2 [Acanthopagrus latus]